MTLRIQFMATGLGLPPDPKGNSMMYYRFEQDFVHKTSGISVSNGYEYIMRIGRFSRRDGYDGRFIAGESENMPEWAQDDPLSFWKAADNFTEERGDVCYRQIISLPRGMTDDAYIEIARQLSRKLSIAENGLVTPCSWALHEHIASDGGSNIHMHRFYSRCCNDNIPRPKPQFFAHAARKHPERGGAPKSRSVRTKKWLLDARKKAEEVINQALQCHGFNDRVSCLRYEEQPGDHSAEIARRRERWSREEWERRQKLLRETAELKKLQNDNLLKLEKLFIEEKDAAAERDKMQRQIMEELRQQEEQENERRRFLASKLASFQIPEPTTKPH